MDSKKDFIFLEGLETRCVIGILDWERKVRQKVRIDLEFPTNSRRAARRDTVEDTTNYKQIAKFLLRELPKTRFQLVESLAEFIAERCLSRFPLEEIKVRVSKPGAIRGARDVGVQITRRRKNRKKQQASG